MHKSSRGRVTRSKKSSRLSSHSAEKRVTDPLRAIGFSNPLDGEVLQPSRIEDAALLDVMLRAIAPGDDHPAVAIPLSVAREMESLTDHLAEEGVSGPIATIIHGWAAKLRAHAELTRRAEKARAA